MDTRPVDSDRRCMLALIGLAPTIVLRDKSREVAAQVTATAFKNSTENIMDVFEAVDSRIACR